MGHELLATALYTVVLAGLFVGRKRLGTFASVALFFVLSILYLKLGFRPALPASAFKLYVAVLLPATLLYVTSSEDGTRAFFSPLRALVVDPRYKPFLYATLLVVPLVVAVAAYAASIPKAEPPPRIRSVHPAPPNTISVLPPGQTEAKTIDVIRDRSPYRAYEESDPELFREKVAHGKVVYYENCFYCHGDTLAGDGHHASELKPPPANFQDKGTIAMLTETFLFWRIAKGGPGLPDEATPFDSSMPVWEKFLSEDDMWSVVLYLYDFTGTRPRTQEELAETGKVHEQEPSGIEAPGEKEGP